MWELFSLDIIFEKYFLWNLLKQEPHSVIKSKDFQQILQQYINSS